jgi:two-component system NtrC family sensor kinase
VADAHQLEQVFLNIINNAVDAMLENGRGGSLQVEVTSAKDQVAVRVRDSGPGIKEVNRIFDPFYTTKAVGKGTGLGLSICYGIIKEHGGDIRAFNHPEGGAVLEVLVPTASAEAVATFGTNEVATRRVPLQGRVLLVDDEEAVLDFEREVLMGAGAEVVCRRSAEEAITALASESFDAILLDSSMPGALNGLDFLRWIGKHRPELKSQVIMAFSGVPDGELRKMIQEEGIHYISKPFEVSELITLTENVVRGRQSAATV